MESAGCRQGARASMLSSAIGGAGLGLLVGLWRVSAVMSKLGDPEALLRAVHSALWQLCGLSTIAFGAMILLGCVAAHQRRNRDVATVCGVAGTLLVAAGACLLNAWTRGLLLLGTGSL